MSAALRLLTVLAVCCALLASCANPYVAPEKPWPSREVAAPSEKVLWTVCSMSLSKSGFHVGTGADPAKLTIETGWKTQLAPFRGDGFRQRAHLRVEPGESGKWRVEVRVERETNMDIKRPMELSYADWKPAPDDEQTAELILERVRAYLSDKLPAEQGS